MYMSLGEKGIVKKTDIIGIFDIEKSSTSRDTREFLRLSEKNKIVKNVSYDMPGSFVVCQSNKKNKVYISHLSAATLSKRFAEPLK